MEPRSTLGRGGIRRAAPSEQGSAAGRGSEPAEPGGGVLNLFELGAEERRRGVARPARALRGRVRVLRGGQPYGGDGPDDALLRAREPAGVAGGGPPGGRGRGAGEDLRGWPRVQGDQEHDGVGGTASPQRGYHRGLEVVPSTTHGWDQADR